MTTLRTWLRKLFARRPRPFRRATTWGGLTVEALEDRTVPSAARLPALQQPPPALMSVTALSNTEVQLDFNRRLGQGHALTSTYAIPGLSVLSATPSNQRRTVTLTTSSQDDAAYDVTLANLRTRGGKRITVPANAGTFQGIGLPDTILPRVAGAVSTGNTTILVSFSEAMADSALDPAHYSVTQTNVNPEAGTVRVLDVRFLDDSRTAVELETSPQNELTYTVKAVNITDLAGNALAPAVFFGGERIDPGQANFAGTPPSGAEIVDSDGDGLSDNDELRGWTVVVKQVNGTLLSRQVTSDPLSVDTDGEGFTDAVEAQLRLDPRDADTDDDLLTDFQEYTEIFCDHLNQDSDGDGVDDGTEFLGVFSSPTHADTDGDQIPDGEEIPNPNRNPLVADLPTPAIEIGNINLQLDVRFTETTSTGTRELETKSVTSSLTQSDNKTFSNENSNTQEAMAKLSVGTEFTVDTGLLGLLADGLEFKTNVGVETSYTGSWTTTNTTTSARATERAYQDSLTTDAETTAGATVERSVLAARMQVTVFLRNPSTMSFNVRNLQLTAFLFDPSDPTRLTPVATLLPEQAPAEGFNLGPLVPERGPFIFANDSIFPAQVESLMRNPGSVVFRISNFDILDEAGRNFAFTSRDVSDLTTSLVIDFGGSDADGDGEGDLTEYNRVAVSAGRIAIDTNDDGVVDDNDRRVDFDRLGVHVGITLRQALFNLRLTAYDEAVTPSSTLTDEQLQNSYSVLTDPNGFERIFRIRTVAREIGSPKAWEIFTPEGIVRPKSLDDMVMTPRSDIKLVFVQDLDGDRLPGSLEFLQGTSDTNKDTDGDFLDDRFETLKGWTVDLGALGTRRVFSDPTLADSDGDSIGDNIEAPSARTFDADGLIVSAVRSSAGDIITDPQRSDTDGDGVTDFAEFTGYDITLRNPPQGSPGTINVRTNPERADTDNDTVPDGVERRLGGDPTDPSDRDSFADDDGDGLANVEETDGWDFTYSLASATNGVRGTLISFRVTSDPNRADTDGDGIFDGEEFLRRLHPSRGDSDLDGLTDFQETRGFQLRDVGVIFTDPLDADTDHDKLRDGREAELVDVEANRWIVRVEGQEPYRVFSDPLTADADFDGVADGDERTAGTDPTKFNTDGDGRDDGVELRDGFNPLAEDFRVRVTLVGLTIDDDADSGVLSNTGPGEFRFAFIVQPPVGDLLLVDGSGLPGGDVDGNVSISSGTTFRLNVGISFTMTASQTFTVTGLLEEYDDLVLRESRGTKVTFGNLDDTPITMPDGMATGPGFFMGKDLLDDPFIQYYTVTFGVGDNVGMDDNTVLAHIKGSLRFAITVQP